MADLMLQDIIYLLTTRQMENNVSLLVQLETRINTSDSDEIIPHIFLKLKCDNSEVPPCKQKQRIIEFGSQMS